MENTMTFKPNEGFKIQISGTDFEIESIYLRTRWARSLDGKTVEVQGNVYLSKDKFKQDENKTLAVDIVKIEDGESVAIPPMGNYGVHEVPENYDNNDLAFSQNVIIDELSKFLYNEIPPSTPEH